MFLYHFKNFYPGVGRDRLIEVAAQFRIVASLGYLLVNSSVKRNQESLLRSRQVADALTEQCGHKTFQISWFWADNGQTGQNFSEPGTEIWKSRLFIRDHRMSLKTSARFRFQH
jgi:hypothetical protein